MIPFPVRSGGIKNKFRPLLLSVLFLVPLCTSSQESFQVVFPDIIIGGIPAEIRIESVHPIHDSTILMASFHQKKKALLFKEKEAIITVLPVHGEPLVVQINDKTYVSEGSAIPLWYSAIPPLIAILFALLFKEVFTALMLGLFSGTAAIAWYGGSTLWEAPGIGLLRIIDTYIIQTITSPDHVAIIVFSFLIGGMVHIITTNGGMKGVVNVISRFARTRKSALLSTWFMGLVVFFDDYANTLVVGNTMRPLTDKMQVSREKLSYVIDSTAAPVAAIAFITTWIGAELSYIKNAADAINLTAKVPLNENAYAIFFQSLPYSFYPILTLLFVFFIIITGRDFGPMRRAERKAVSPDPADDPWQESDVDRVVQEMEPETSLSPKPYNAIIPVGVVILGTCLGLYFTGLQVTGWNPQMGFSTNLSNIIGNADTFRALLWASFGGVITAIGLSVFQRILSLNKAVSSMINGFKTMMTAMMILVLAWSLAALTTHLHTADFLSGVMLQLNITPRWIPAITFIVAALVAFSTGSSWGTMAILYPLILPAGWALFLEAGWPLSQSLSLFHIVVASVLAGAVFGDHCSPISDTTILSSLATRCNHIDHVRTQIPYALSVGIVSIAGGIIPVSFGLHPGLAFLISILFIFLIIRIIGKSR